MLEKRELGVEPGAVWLTGKQRIGLRQYPMEDHHRQSPSVTAGRQHVKQPAKAHGCAPAGMMKANCAPTDATSASRIAPIQ